MGLRKDEVTFMVHRQGRIQNLKESKMKRRKSAEGTRHWTMNEKMRE